MTPPLSPIAGVGDYAGLRAVLDLPPFPAASLRDSRLSGPPTGHSSKAKPVSVLTRLSGAS